MYPASTKSGGAVVAFPDVCTTPGGPVPIPYPNVAKSPVSKTQPTAQKLPPGGLTTGFPSLHPAPAQLRTKLATLHGQLSALPAGNPNQWHTVVDDYVMTVAALYIALTDH
jgi:Toxin PAAR-like domain